MRSLSTYVVEGVVLKRISSGDADRIVTLFTKQYGKIRGIAKGVRRISSKRAPHLEVFTHTQCVLHASRGLDVITEASGVNHFHGIHGDLSRVASAYYICELVDALLPEKHAYEDVFTLLIRALCALEGEKQPIVLREFPKILLEMLGYYPKGGTPIHSVNEVIEGLIEKHLKTPKLLRETV